MRKRISSWNDCGPNPIQTLRARVAAFQVSCLAGARRPEVSTHRFSGPSITLPVMLSIQARLWKAGTIPSDVGVPEIG